MDAARWRQTRSLFDELVLLAPEERAERLAVLAHRDPDLHDAVASLLAADERSSAGLAPPLAPLPGQDPFGLAGQTVAHFRVLEPLGAGGMGVLYRAVDTRLGRMVALKFLLPHLTLDSSSKERFLREAHLAAALDHPNLCTIHEASESEDGRLFLAMPLYPGETLRARLSREGSLSIDETLKIARQVAEGLACAHGAGIVHRDLKPGNLMLLPDGTVKILDFGLARSVDQHLTGSGVLLGTAAYMAPEQIEGRQSDGRSDLWALGVVTYEMLTGRRPFDGSSETAVARAILHDEPTTPSSLRSGIPAALEELVLLLLCKDPELRAGSAAELAEMLAGIAAGSARAISRPLRQARPRTRWTAVHRRAAAGAGVVTLGALLWIVGTARESGRETLNPRLVVVSPFLNLTGDPSLDIRGQMAAHWITLGLTEHSIAEVADYSLGEPPVRNAAMLEALARETGAGLVVTGSYHRQGDDLLMIARITDAEEGTVLRELGPFRGTVNGPLEEVEHLRNEVLGALAMHLDPANPLEQVAGQSPPSYDAYRAYLEAFAELQRSDFGAWMEGTRRALALDSTFLQILDELTWSYIGLGDCAPIDSIWRELQLRRDRVPETIRLEVAQTQALCHRSYEAAWDIGRRVLALKPASAQAQLRLAFAGVWSGRLRESAELFRNMDLTRGLHVNNPFTDEVHIEVLHLLGDNEGAIRVAEQARQRHPEFVRNFYFGLASLAALGRVEEIELRMAEARRTTLPGGGADTYRDMADELAWHGHEAAARRFAALALQGFQQLPDSVQRTPFYRVARAGALLHLQRWREMRAAVDSIFLPPDRWLVGSPQTANQGLVLALRGIAAAKMRDDAGVRAALEGIARLPGDQGPHYYMAHEIWEAQILAASGDKEAALRKLREGRDRGGLPRSDPRITHDEPGFRDLWHDPAFEALFAMR